MVFRRAASEPKNKKVRSTLDRPNLVTNVWRVWKSRPVNALEPKALTRTTPHSDVLVIETKGNLMKVKPLYDRVLVQRLEQESKSAGGIIIPDTAKEKPQEGTIVAAGPGRLTDDGSRVPMELEVGDTVVYSKYAGTEYKEGDIEYLVLREDDILFKK